MIHRSFNKAHQSNPQHKHNQLGWFWSTEESKPVFLADHAYGVNLPFTSEYFMDEKSKSGGFCIGPDSEATEASWEERKTFLKEMVLTDLRLEVTYLLSLSACAMGYLNLVNESVPTVKVHLNEGNVQMAEHLFLCQGRKQSSADADHGNNRHLNLICHRTPWSSQRIPSSSISIIAIVK